MIKESHLEEENISNHRKNHSLTPIINNKAPAKGSLDSVKVKNMRALIDNKTGAINLRSIIQMDNEP